MDKKTIIFLSSLCFLLYFWGLGSTPFHDRGEPRESLVVSEMYGSGNWTLPLVNGEYIPYKPPLFHWIGIIVASCLGRVNEFATRFPSALFATLGVLLTYFAALKLWSENSALIAAFVLATNMEWWNAATIAQVDMTLAFFVTAALIYFMFVYGKKQVKPHESIGIAILLALAVLSKGPVGAALPVLVIFVYLLLRRDLAFVNQFNLVRGAFALILVAGSWYAAAGWQGGKAFFVRQIIEESFSTAVASYGHYQPPYYLIPVLMTNLLPWSLFFPSLAFFIYKKRGRLDQEKLLFPIVWFLIVLLFFSLARGKRGIYILPLYPSVALLFGAWWRELESRGIAPAWYERWIGYYVAASALLALVVASALLGGVEALNQPAFPHWARSLQVPVRYLEAIIPTRHIVVTCIALLGIGALLLIRGVTARAWNAVFIGLGTIALSQGLATERAYYPSIAAQRTMKPFAERLSQEFDPESPLFFYRAYDYGVMFYSNRHLPQFPHNAKESVKVPFYLLMWEEQWNDLADKPGLEVMDTSDGTGATGRHHMLLVRVTDTAALPRPADHPLKRPSQRSNGDEDEAS